MKSNIKRRRRPRRTGAAVVEFACVAPLFVLLLFGSIEIGRALMVQQALTNATREGAREAALPDATSTSVKEIVTASLAGSSVDVTSDDILVSPDPVTAYRNEQISVSVKLPYARVGWVPGSFLKGITLQSSTQMRTERLE